MANDTDLPPQRAAEGETVTLPVIQEQLHVGTRTVETGRGVRVHKQVRSRPHEVDQTLWRDELDVRHVPVDRLVNAPPAARYEGDTFIVPVLEEVLVVEKRYRIKEELHITRLRHASQHRQTVPLRDEHVAVERFDDGDGGQPSSILTKEATMAHTLAAVFENRGDADRAKAGLLNAGFSSSDVRVASGTGSSTDAQPSTDDSIGGGIMHFFSSIFGSDDNADKQLYSSAINRGHVVLTVDAGSDDEVERAADIIEGYGPLDIDSPQGLSHQTSPQMGHQGAAYQGAQAGVAGSMQDAHLAGSGMMHGTQSGSTGSMQDAQMAASGTMQGAQSGVPGSLQDAQLAGSGTIQGTQSGVAGSMQRATTEEQAIPVIQEELKVGKRTVQRGGVRVYQRVIETPVHEDVTLREEHVTIERHAVDQAIAPDQVPAFQEKSFELRESAEEAVVQKSARVVEEVVVGKEVSQRQDQITDTLRSTQVEIEQIAPEADAHFRSHWQSNFASAGGGYEDYDPAYRYGSSMASNTTYKGRQWNDVEPDLRRDWESQYPQSGWDKFKAAVREGWDRMTS
jgi:uncharacterized protein (TIGR02271 family)